MGRPPKPLKLRDTTFSGKPVEGFVVVRIVDGGKLASKQFTLDEAVEIRNWLAAFIRNHRYINHYPANIEEVTKLSSVDLDTIRQRFENGESLNKLADEFGVPLTMIMGISRT